MSSEGPVYIVEAPAKINLTLEILGRRPDGYHDLRSVVVPIGLTDQIELTGTAGGVETHVTADAGIDLTHLGDSDSNLATRAAYLLQRRCQVRDGVRIRIHKRIPLGGGLGGGSADAAGTLVGLNALWNLGLAREALMALGAELGSDVPALVHGGAVCMEGRGERVTPILKPTDHTVRAFWVLVVNPGFACSTAEVFRNCRCARDLTECPDVIHNVSSSVRSGDVHSAAAALFNGLQAVVFAQYPVTAALVARLRAAGALGVLLSGSGASVFALVRDWDHGEAVRRCLGAGVWSVLTTTLPDGVMVAHGPLEP